MWVDEPERDEASVAWFGRVLEFEGRDPVMATWVFVSSIILNSESRRIVQLREGRFSTYNTLGKASRRPCRVSALP